MPQAYGDAWLNVRLEPCRDRAVGQDLPFCSSVRPERSRKRARGGYELLMAHDETLNLGGSRSRREQRLE